MPSSLIGAWVLTEQRFATADARRRAVQDHTECIVGQGLDAGAGAIFRDSRQPGSVQGWLDCIDFAEAYALEHKVSAAGLSLGALPR